MVFMGEAGRVCLVLSSAPDDKFVVASAVEAPTEFEFPASVPAEFKLTRWRKEEMVFIVLGGGVVCKPCLMLR